MGFPLDGLLVEPIRDDWPVILLHPDGLACPRYDGSLRPRTAAGAMIYTDDWVAYASLPRRGWVHASVNHLRYEWERRRRGRGAGGALQHPGGALDGAGGSTCGRSGA